MLGRMTASARPWESFVVLPSWLPPLRSASLIPCSILSVLHFVCSILHISIGRGLWSLELPAKLSMLGHAAPRPRPSYLL